MFTRGVISGWWKRVRCIAVGAIRLPVSAVFGTAAAAASRGMARMVSISSAFDGGNIQVECQTAEAVQLKIKPDPYTELEKKAHMQSFAFKATADSTSPEQKVMYEIINAKDVSFPDAWEGTTVCYSTDSETWQRVSSTSFDRASGVLRWEWTHAGAESSVFFAYFDLYPYERQLRLVARCAVMAAGAQAPAGLRVRSLGQTLEGRELDCISVGTGPLQAWAIHRQHPGESQASFFAEGLLDRLLGLRAASVTDGLVQRALRLFTFHIVPNMNPDGSVRGYLRVNAGGANLNREWAPTADYAAPTAERSPEVLHTLAALHATGVDLFIDVHGESPPLAGRPPQPALLPSSLRASQATRRSRLASWRVPRGWACGDRGTGRCTAPSSPPMVAPTPICRRASDTIRSQPSAATRPSAPTTSPRHSTRWR